MLYLHVQRLPTKGERKCSIPFPFHSHQVILILKFIFFQPFIDLLPLLSEYETYSILSRSIPSRCK